MYTSEKIKEILIEMIESDEFEKVIKCKEYSSKERKQAKKYYEALKGVKDIKKIEILPLIMTMPRIVMLDVIAYLIPYKLVKGEKECMNCGQEVEKQNENTN